MALVSCFGDFIYSFELGWLDNPAYVMYNTGRFGFKHVKFSAKIHVFAKWRVFVRRTID